MMDAIIEAGGECIGTVLPFVLAFAIGHFFYKPAEKEQKPMATRNRRN